MNRRDFMAVSSLSLAASAIQGIGEVHAECAIAPPPADSTTIILQMTANPGREEEFVGVAKDIMKLAPGMR